MSDQDLQREAERYAEYQREQEAHEQAQYDDELSKAEQRIRELEAEVAAMRKTEGHYQGCHLRVKLAAGIAPMCTPCTCDEIQQKRADKAAIARAEAAEAKLREVRAWHKFYAPALRDVGLPKAADELEALLK